MELYTLQPSTDIRSQMPPYLPGEITDAIIALVWPNRATVLNCALVCRQWLPTSRHHLFSEIEIRSSSAYDNFIERILQPEDMKPWLSSVRRFTFVDQQLRARATAARTKDRSGRGAVFVHDITDKLPNLESLSLTVDWLSAPLHSGAYDAFSSFALQDLILDSCQFPSFESLCRILTALPNLKRLRLRDVTWPLAVAASAGPSAVVQKTRLGLLALDIAVRDLQTSETVFRWLAQTSSRASIRNLAVTSPFFERPFLWTYSVSHADSLRRLATSVVVLRLSVCGGHRLEGEVPMRDFANLKKLTVDFRGNVSWVYASYPLSALRSPIEHLTLRLLRGRETGLKRTSVPSVVKAPFGDGPELLDGILVRDQFNGLKSVELHLNWDFGDSAAWELPEVERLVLPKLRAALPMLRMREISTVHLACRSRCGEPQTSVVRL